MSGLPSRGYIYIDSGFPRRPGDRARLLSPDMEPTGADRPLCLRFWAHMFGNGVGTLSIGVRPTTASAGAHRQLWSLTGEAGNSWHQGQLTISSFTDFQVILSI